MHPSDRTSPCVEPTTTESSAICRHHRHASVDCTPGRSGREPLAGAGAGRSRRRGDHRCAGAPGPDQRRPRRAGPAPFNRVTVLDQSAEAWTAQMVATSDLAHNPARREQTGRLGRDQRGRRPRQPARDDAGDDPRGHPPRVPELTGPPRHPARRLRARRRGRASGRRRHGLRHRGRRLRRPRRRPGPAGPAPAAPRWHLIDLAALRGGRGSATGASSAFARLSR